VYQLINQIKEINRILVI